MPLAAALRYADLGYPVFPCVPNGKAPLTARGFHDATVDAEQIETWWAQHPGANIGIPTEGLLVVDVDGDGNPWPNDPNLALDLAIGAISLTPRGGKHYIFQQPVGKNWRCSASALAPNVDVRAAGGYIVVPPSVVYDKPYRWAPGMELDCSPDCLPEPPSWLIRELDRLGSSVNGTSRLTNVVADSPRENAIPEGQRNSTLASLGGTMRRVGMSQAEILAALRQTNRDRCNPPLDEHEVKRIAESISRYEPDQVAVALVENHWEQIHIETPLNGDNNNGLPTTGPILTCMADVEPRDICWLWPDRIPLGRITLLIGRPGEGKSFLAIDAAARVSRGTPWPDGSECPSGSVILISSEDDPSDTIRPRLDAHDADARKIHLLAGVRRRGNGGQPYETSFVLKDLEMLKSALQTVSDCKLIVIDPIGSFLGGDTDAHRDNEVRAVLAPVAQLAERYGPAVLMIAHRRKALGRFADDLALGSRAFTGIARSVWHLTRDPENKSRRLMLSGKNNLVREGDGLAFTITGNPARIEWEPGPVEMLADDILVVENGLCAEGARRPGPTPTALDTATCWLAELLKDGPLEVPKIKTEGGKAGFSWRTLHRAKDELGIQPYRELFSGPWLWRLPDAPIVPS